MWLKRMIERCIGRAQQHECDTCDRRDSCVATRWNEALAFPGAGGAAAAPRPGGGAFLAFLGDIARAIEPRAAAGRPAFRRDVERRIEPLLASGDVGIERMAREMGLSRQTLYRRLKVEGVTYEQLLDELRHRLALRYILKEGVTVKEAAYRLGFSDPSAFSRAFRRWTGRSPGFGRG